MFSYLRPHKRGNANSATNEPAATQAPTTLPAAAQSDTFLSTPSINPRNASSRSPVPQYPPILPPIPRVASQYGPKAYKEREHIEYHGQNPTDHQEAERHSRQRRAHSAHNDGIKEEFRGRDANSPSTISSRDTFSRSSDEQRVRNGGFSNERATKPLPLPRTSSSELAQGNNLRQIISLGNSSLNDRPASKATNNSTTASSGKPGKNRLHLKNPMSLLMRRRFGNSNDHSAESQHSNSKNGVPAMSFPDDYDPRIKGKGVHDFSAPRSRRVIFTDQGRPQVTNFDSSSSREGIVGTPNQRDANSDQMQKEHGATKFEKPHAAVFKENFDEQLDQADNRGVRAEALANQKFLSRVSIPPPDHPPPPPPPSAPHSAVSPLTKAPPSQPDEGTQEASQQEIVDQTIPEEYEDENVISSGSKSRKSSRAARSRTTSIADGFQPAGLPTHMTSKASRFSFQIGGNDSAAQEKLLEERHKAKAAAKAQSSTQNIDDDEYDEDMYDPDFNGFDGIEEDIPLTGVDDYEEDVPLTGMDDYEEDVPLTGVDDYENEGLGFSQLAINTKSIDYPSHNPFSPADSNGEHLYSATTDTDTIPSSIEVPAPLQPRTAEELSALGIVNALPATSATYSNESGNLYTLSKLDTIQPLNYTSGQNPLDLSVSNESGLVVDEDDLYFDDGLIDGPLDGEGEHFDEDAFDDPSHPLYERPAPLQPSANAEKSSSNRASKELHPDHTSQQLKLGDEASFEHAGIEQDAKEDDDAIRPKKSLGGIEAYYSALAEAANKAAADGRFKRKDSVDSSMANWENVESNSSRNAELESSQIGSFSTWTPEDDGVGFDDTIDDDDIIAAANAEALANDYDGFYGQEFGFYAAAQGEVDLTNGGYFGPRGIDALGRSVSGRNAVREPNLTPITERSEYSTRNSFISLSHYNAGSGSQPVTSPALAQLAQMTHFGFPEDDPERSMIQLMKLRRDAFGGSGGSKGGSNSSSPRNSSPTASMILGRGMSPMAGPGMNAWEMGHGDANLSEGSPILLEEEDEDDPDNDAIAAANEYDSDGQNDDTIVAADWNGGVGGSQSATMAALDGSPPVQDMAGAAGRAGRAGDRPQEIHHTPSGEKGTTAASPSSRGSQVSTDPSVSPEHGKSTSSTMSPANGPAAGHKEAIGTGPGGRASHSRAGSTADSVTYVKEQDEGGGERWVLERRRTAETGEMELVGREIVEGGRI